MVELLSHLSTTWRICSAVLNTFDFSVRVQFVVDLIFILILLKISYLFRYLVIVSYCCRSNRSTDNTMPSADGAYVGQDSTGQQPRLNPLHSLKGGAVQSDKSLAQALQALQVESNKLRNGITNLKVRLAVCSIYDVK